MPVIRRPLKLGGVTDVDWAYAAGIMDGEGCITIVKQSYRAGHPDNYCLRVEVSTSDDTICPWLYTTFGGVLSTNIKTTHTPAGASYVGPVNRWTVASAACEQFVRGILPWLKLKKGRAELALEFRATFGIEGKNITDDIRSQREKMYYRMKVIRASRRIA